MRVFRNQRFHWNMRLVADALRELLFWHGESKEPIDALDDHRRLLVASYASQALRMNKYERGDILALLGWLADSGTEVTGLDVQTMLRTIYERYPEMNDPFNPTEHKILMWDPDIGFHDPSDPVQQKFRDLSKGMQ